MNKARFSKLRARIKEKNYTEAEVATLIGLSHGTFSKKLNCINEFLLVEIDRLCEILDIEPAEKWIYF